MTLIFLIDYVILIPQEKIAFIHIIVCLKYQVSYPEIHFILMNIVGVFCSTNTTTTNYTCKGKTRPSSISRQTIQKKIKYFKIGKWRDGLEFKNACCFCRGPEFSS